MDLRDGTPRREEVVVRALRLGTDRLAGMIASVGASGEGLAGLGASADACPPHGEGARPQASMIWWIWALMLRLYCTCWCTRRQVRLQRPLMAHAMQMSWPFTLGRTGGSGASRSMSVMLL